MTKSKITITPIDNGRTSQNMQGMNEWWIHVDDNYAGSIYEARNTKAVCVTPNDGFGVNSALRKWWGACSSVAVAMKFVKDNFSVYVAIAAQQHLNETHSLRSEVKASA